jgi:uroporphyrinogen decarboxylase
MQPRERVQLALNHVEPDRAPFGATFTPEFADRLRAQLGLPPRTTSYVHDPHHGRWNGYDLELATGQDILHGGIGWVTNYYLDAKPFTDEWGVQWGIKQYDTPFGKGFYTEMKKHPLADDAAVDGYRAPDPERPELYTNLQRLIDGYQADYFISGWLPCTIFETAWALRGFQQMLLDFMVDPEITDRILEIPYQYHRAVARRMAQMGVDMIWLGDDMGSQKYMLISPDTWRTFFKQRMADLIAEAKAINPRLNIAYHSDGSVYPIIPDLIEIGVDVLNPIQTDSMDPVLLKQTYGDNLCFFGAIDVQSTLPFGTPESIRAEFLQRLATMGRGGGWICAPTHHVQLDTPLENFWALVDAVHATPYTAIHQTAAAG